ncbi:putative flavoprotein involved in K+ transport [Pseudonocardia ammonioxydans]|uniref:Putative flavoprotein involved in K+ transport n=1 Tax=Pseudonocardia ammonioxydans TaxID=260086 RepID=A0A1I5GVG1_PSUAM|nr:NAD(P)/FAD-dependent oxidoreductase [Pseudonocardia ammonioxydans]SFO39985.1 putative flavoprotein involved in K+ transport [Pseudonocardia ammonioxydans]
MRPKARSGERVVTTGRPPDRVDVLVVGAGQAGLATSWHLGRAGIDHVVVDAAARVGDSWRQRWDSLRLFTPAGANGLPGMPMTANDRHPTKDHAADHLERYVARFGLPVHVDSPVRHLRRGPDGFTAAIRDHVLHARRVVVASGAHRCPRIPAFAAGLDPAIVQLASTDYRNPGRLPDGPVLIVGAANSGAEIALDIALAGRHRVHLAGRDVGRLPQLGTPVFTAMRHLRTDRGTGRFLARLASGGGDPLGRVRPRDLTDAGIRREGRITDVDHGVPVTESHPLPGLASVIWCTGLGPDLSWLAPDLRRSSIEAAPASDLATIGWPYQRTMASHLLGGVGHDAANLTQKWTSS